MLALTLLSNKLGKFLQIFFSLIFKEIYFGPGSNLKIKKFTKPSLNNMNNDNVLVKTSLCSVCGTDLLKFCTRIIS